jgi:hypothetical protein
MSTCQAGWGFTSNPPTVHTAQILISRVQATPPACVVDMRLLELFLMMRSETLVRSGLSLQSALLVLQLDVALRTGVDHSPLDEYRYPAILRDRGFASSVNVPVQTDSGSFGILEIDHTSRKPSLPTTSIF